MVTHSGTNLAIRSLDMAERTGCLGFFGLWPQISKLRKPSALEEVIEQYTSIELPPLLWDGIYFLFFPAGR